MTLPDWPIAGWVVLVVLAAWAVAGDAERAWQAWRFRELLSAPDSEAAS